MKTPPGFPAPPGGFGLFWDGSPKETCDKCKSFVIIDGKYFCGWTRRDDGHFEHSIKKASPACKLFKKAASKPKPKKEIDTRDRGLFG